MGRRPLAFFNYNKIFFFLKQLLLIGSERCLVETGTISMISHIKYTINKTDHQSYLKTKNTLLKRRAH
jgi:hypothetical protein